MKYAYESNNTICEALPSKTTNIQQYPNETTRRTQRTFGSTSKDQVLILSPIVLTLWCFSGPAGLATLVPGLADWQWSSALSAYHLWPGITAPEDPPLHPRMGLPDLAGITEEAELQLMLDNATDFDERKAIRGRIREIKEDNRHKMDARLKKTETAREEMLAFRHKQADDAKQRYLHMYEDAAKHGNIGAGAKWDTEQYKKADTKIPTPRPAVGVTIPGGTKAPPSAKAAMNAFKAADAANNPQNQGKTLGAGKAAPNLSRSPTAIKDMLLNWAAKMTEGYPNVSVTNFSGSWANGLAFCALVHRFFPEAFDFNSLDPNNRKANLTLAFKKAEELADISPLLEVDDMLMMKDKPDWKCVFCYVQGLYRGLHQLTPPQQ